MDMTKETSQSSNKETKIIKLLIREDQTVLTEGKVYDDNELLSMIKVAIKDVQKYSIILTSKDNVTYQRFIGILSYLKLNDIQNVSIGIRKNEVKKK